MKNESIDDINNDSNKQIVPNPGFTLDSLSFDQLKLKTALSFNYPSSNNRTENNFYSFISLQTPHLSMKLTQSPTPNNLFIEKQIYSNAKAQEKANKYFASIQKNSTKSRSMNMNAKTLFNVINTEKTTGPSELKQFHNYNEKKLVEEFNSLTSHIDTSHTLSPIYQSNANQETSPSPLCNNDYIIESLASLLNLFDPIMNELGLEEKIRKCIGMLEDKRRRIRLGGIAAIYLIVKKYEMEISTSCYEELYSTMIDALIKYNSQQEEEELFIVCCIEVLSLYDYQEQILEHIPLFIAFIQFDTKPLLQNASFNLLMKMEYDGIKALIEFASDIKNPISHYVLDKLLQTPHIQSKVIVPSLVKVLYSKDSQENKLSALAALNRMYDVINDNDIIDSLIELYTDKNMPKEYIASILRSTNMKAAEVNLISQFETNKDFLIKNSIANVFGVRYPKSPHYLSMKLEKNDSFALSNHLGSLCSYCGNMKPVIELCYYSIEELIDQDHNNNSVQSQLNSNDYLKVNPRDLICALNRMLTIEMDHSNPRLTHNRKVNILDTISLSDSNNDILSSYSPFFEIINLDNQEKNSEDQGSNFISQKIVKTLCKGLNDFSVVVRETVATSIGKIGLPEAQIAIDALMDSIDDEDINVSSKIIWAIGRISQGVSSDVIPNIVNILRTNSIWKKKKACLYALGRFGSRCSSSVISFLVKLFKESIINKEQICNVILKIGNEGEKELIQMLSNDLPDKLAAIIIQTLSNMNLHSSNIDFVIEKIYRQSNHSNQLIRKSVLQTLFNIFIRSKEVISYMKNDNLIPFFYDRLSDKDISIQKLAIKCIKSLGPQGELVLIEGFTRDTRTQVRINCAIGLSELGIHNIRTLIQGLCDKDSALKRKVEKILNSKMPIDAIMHFFTSENSSRETQLQSLLASIITILDNKYVVSLQTLEYLTQLQNQIEKQTQNSIQLSQDEFTNQL